MAKKPKPVEEAVSAETLEPETAVVEPAIDSPSEFEPLTSDDRGDSDGRVLAEAGAADASKPEPNWKPGSCINCGETTTDAVQAIAGDRFRCIRCKHEWTLAEEQAPFRRLARR